MHQLADVFGVMKGVPSTYVSRPYVDDEFLSALGGDKLIVVFGSSKQGKSSLRKKHLDPKSYVTIQCTSSTTREKLYEMILKEAGARINVTETRARGTHHTIKVTLGAEGRFIVAKAKGDMGGERESTEESQAVTRTLEIDPSDPNDVIRVLREADFERAVFIEDFHYLDNKTQEAIAADLKVFYEQADLHLIIVGVWLGRDRLTHLNGDLDGRTTYIDADRWDESELRAVLQKGAELLNVGLSSTVVDKLLFYCQNNVGLLQQLAAHVCQRIGITRTQTRYLHVRDDSEPPRVEPGRDVNWHGGPTDLWIAELSKVRGKRYANFLRDFAGGPAGSAGNTFRWIAAALIMTPHGEVMTGVNLRRIVQTVMAVDAKLGLQRGTAACPPDQARFTEAVRFALLRIQKFNQELMIQPPILEYDAAEEILRVVDSGFLLHHANHSIGQMLTCIGLDELL